MTTETKPVKARTKTAVSGLTLGNADDALTLATELQKFVKANKLTSNIQGKEFPNVEAWQFAGSLLGLSPMLESIEDKSTADEIKWHATVKIISLNTGNEVGRGFATCSNKESTKKFFADYAICSMAQTRAVGKAYRLSLGWLMKAAGYEATPAEEMSDVGTGATVEEAPKKLQAEAAPLASAPQVACDGADLSPLVAEHLRGQIAGARSLAELKDIWESEAAKPYKRLLANDKEEAKMRIQAAITKAATEKVGPVITAPERPELDPEGKPWATNEQRIEIIRLLNHPVITRGQKSNMLVSMNRFNSERAAVEIQRLNELIDGPNGETERKQVAEAFRKWVREMSYNKLIALKEVERLVDLTEKSSMGDINAAWADARAAVDAAQSVAA